MGRILEGGSCEQGPSLLPTLPGLAPGRPRLPSRGSHPISALGRTGIAKLESEPRVPYKAQRTQALGPHRGGRGGLGAIPPDLCKVGPAFSFSNPSPTFPPFHPHPPPRRGKDGGLLYHLGCVGAPSTWRWGRWLVWSHGDIVVQGEWECSFPSKNISLGC